MRSTIHDVARLAGVSPGTVSRVIHKKTYVKKETKARVLAAIEKLDYRPNVAASRLVLGKTHVIGLLVHDFQKEYYVEVSEAIIEAAKEQGYAVLITTMKGDKSHLLDFLRSGNMDGLLVITPYYIEEEFSMIAKQETPCVFINYESDRQLFSSIYCDQFKIGYLATKYLIDLGHTEIGFCTNNINSPSPTRRFQGCLQAMVAANLDVKTKYVRAIPQNTPVKATREWLRAGDLPSAIFVFSDDIALYVMDVIKDAGYKIPEDISVIGCGNMLVSKWTIPPLTTVDQYTRQIGSQSVDMLLKLMGENERSKREVKIIEPRVVVRESCRNV